jgi:hypothetical protein
MTLQEAKALAEQGTKVTHDYFTPSEWMIIENDNVVFEDGVKMNFDEWVKDKDYLLTGWSKYT